MDGTITDLLGISDPLSDPGNLSDLNLSTPGDSGVTDPNFSVDQTPVSDQGPENFTSDNQSAFDSGMPGSGGSGMLGNIAKAAAGTFGGAAGGAGLMNNRFGQARVPSVRELQMNHTSPGKPVERSHAAPVASADQIEMHWIQRMRLFSGIYAQGRPTV